MDEKKSFLYRLYEECHNRTPNYNTSGKYLFKMNNAAVHVINYTKKGAIILFIYIHSCMDNTHCYM